MALNVVESGEPYNYLWDGEAKMGVVTRIAPVGQTQFVFLDSGDKMPLADFKQVASSAYDDQEEQIHESQNNHYSQAGGGGGGGMPDMGIRLDENGIPILGSGNPEDMIDENMVEVVDPSKTHVAAPKTDVLPTNDPIRLLVDKAKKPDITMDVDLIMGLPDKSLIVVIQESFGEDSVEKVFKHLINNIDPEKFQQSLLKKMYEHYGVEPPGDE